MSRSRKAFLVIAFISLLLSFYCNFFHLVPQKTFEKFDAFDKGFMYGRIMNVEKNGFLSDGGFTGIFYDTLRINEVSRTVSADSAFTIIIHGLLEQKDMYIGTMDQKPDYGPYFTQPGAMASVYSILNLIIPTSAQNKVNIYDFINALLNALVFMLFFWWILKEYGLIPSVVTLAFMLISPWLISFGGNIWWIAGSFYMPVFGMFLLLKANLSEKKILLYLFLLFALKGILTGFEFITCTFLSMFIPVVYYYYYNRRTFKEFFVFSFKAGVVSCLSMLVVTVILIFQHKSYHGGYSDGIQWLFNAFLKRTAEDPNGAGLLEDLGYIFAVYYWFRDAFEINIFGNMFGIPFAIIVGIVFLNLILLYRMVRKNPESRKYKALIFSTALSYLASVSWYTIFKNHARDHMHIDSVCWYMPFLLMGFVCLGVTVNILYKRVIRN